MSDVKSNKKYSVILSDWRNVKLKSESIWSEDGGFAWKCHRFRVKIIFILR